MANYLLTEETAKWLKQQRDGGAASTDRAAQQARARTGGTCARMNNPNVWIPPANEAVLVSPTSNATGGGKYNGRTHAGAVTVNATDNLSASDFGAPESEDNCLILNLREVGSTGHALEMSGYLPTIFIGIPIGSTEDGKLVVAIDGAQDEDCNP